MKKTAYTLFLTTVFLLFIQAHHPDVYVVGDKVNDFALMGVDGQYVSLKNYPTAKGFIVVFTCNHCPYAQLYEQRIIELHK
ncbi:MAG: thioredoxin family protein, partial [Saprospiraceae bacterium]